MWWCTFVIPTTPEPEAGDCCKFEANLNYIVRPASETQKEKRAREKRKERKAKKRSRQADLCSLE